MFPCEVRCFFNILSVKTFYCLMCNLRDAVRVFVIFPDRIFGVSSVTNYPAEGSFWDSSPSDGCSIFVFLSVAAVSGGGEYSLHLSYEVSDAKQGL